MALIGVHVERSIRLDELCAAIDVHNHSVRFDCSQKSGKLRVHVERPVRRSSKGKVLPRRILDLRVINKD